MSDKQEFVEESVTDYETEQTNDELKKNIKDLYDVNRLSRIKMKNVFILGMMFFLSLTSLIMLFLLIGLYFQIDGIKQEIQIIKDTEATINTELSNSANSNVQVDTDAQLVDELENKVLWDDNHLAENVQSDSAIRRVYLTFDDGPSPNTDAILDVLDQYGVKATFFVVGKQNYNSQYKRIVDDGHTLGMHSFSHKYNEIYDSVEAYSNDISKLHDYLYEMTGVDCDIVRFPGGSSNTISKVDMKELVNYLNEEDMLFFDWNVSSGDALGKNVSADKIASNVLDNVNKYKNVIILFHDAAGKQSTVEALPKIIETILESSDTVLLPISRDTFPVQHLH